MLQHHFLAANCCAFKFFFSTFLQICTYVCTDVCIYSVERNLLPLDQVDPRLSISSLIGRPSFNRFKIKRCLPQLKTQNAEKPGIAKHKPCMWDIRASTLVDHQLNQAFSKVMKLAGSCALLYHLRGCMAKSQVPVQGKRRMRPT